LGALSLVRSETHKPACTHAISASTAATVRIENQPRGARLQQPNPSPRFGNRVGKGDL
jgi:hypothetical protein